MWFGAFTSTIGTWMQKVAQSWLVLTITGSSSAFFLGLDSFLGELPILLLTLVGGVVADRYDRRRLLLSHSAFRWARPSRWPGSSTGTSYRIWHVLTLSVITGLAQAFGGPAYQSLLPSLVGKNDVPNAIAFNSIQFNLARVIGPLLAGAALAAFGMVACFGLNGLSFLAVIAAILSLHIRHTPLTSKTRMHHELKSGFEYALAHPALISIAVLGFAATFLGGPLLTFLPLFAQNVFHGGVTQYTHLMSFAGAGAVTGALVVAWLGKFKHMGRTLLTLQVVFGVLIVLFALTRIFWINACCSSAAPHAW
jgi:MFS family permease